MIGKALFWDALNAFLAAYDKAVAEAQARENKAWAAGAERDAAWAKAKARSAEGKVFGIVIDEIEPRKGA